MKARAILAWAAFLFVLLGPATASAAISCNTITSPGISINLVNGQTSALQTYFRVTCSRTSTSDPTSISYSVKVNDGLQPNGINNNSRLGGEDIRYDVYTSACNGQKWKGNVAISDTITWAAGQTGAQFNDTTFWGCVNTAVTATTSGDHSDSITMTLTYNPGSGNQTITGTIGVDIYAPAVCTIPVGFGPGTIALTYTSFSASAVSGSTNFRTQCTVGMPYTLDVSPASGTLAGVNYTIAPSTTTTNGTGAQQSFSITATAGAGQAGTCSGTSCTQSQTHTLTIGY